MNEVCRETLQRAYLFLDGEVLSETERFDIQVHLEECTPCLERYGLEQELFSLMARLRTANPCPDGLKTRIATLLEQA
ncbi:MAG: zf-HC2 domain-containing protein [Actinomycetota bacterium]|nr:zf-HC2 domain-containing protein [Actinomycetota bacterium]